MDYDLVELAAVQRELVAGARRTNDLLRETLDRLDALSFTPEERQAVRACWSVACERVEALSALEPVPADLPPLLDELRQMVPAFERLMDR